MLAVARPTKQAPPPLQVDTARVVLAGTAVWAVALVVGSDRHRSDLRCRAGLLCRVAGLDYFLLWGILAIVLRFIPYIGPWIAAAFPVALAFAVDPGWTKLLLALALRSALRVMNPASENTARNSP